MRIADVSFYYNRGETDAQAILYRHRVNLEYVRYLPSGCRCAVIKFMDAATRFLNEGVDYHFFRGGGAGVYPHAALSLLKAFEPDLVLIHGFIYPWQAFLVRKTLGKKAVIFLQHHGETVPGGWRKWLMKEADSHVNGYFFTSKAIADNWIKEGVISSSLKVAEVLTGSSALILPGSMASTLLVVGDPVLLWVGRLDHNKDPLTVLEGFSMFLKKVPGARLYMIYQSEETPGALQAVVDADDSLSNTVRLVGAIKYEDLANWYLAADFFVAGSHREACGYALLEAMSCGCIPVVTDIPAFRKITDEGRVGFLYEPGNQEALLQALNKAWETDRGSMKKKVIAHFHERLSFAAIAEQIVSACREMISSKGMDSRRRKGSKGAKEVNQ